MTSARLAVIADVHGNLLALEAVLADIARRGADRIVNLGDCVSGPLWPRECHEILARADMLTVRGNHDRWVSGPDPAATGPSDAFAASELDDAQRKWLGDLPVIADASDGIVAFHATPADDNAYLVEEVHEGHLRRKPEAAIAGLVDGIGARIILCAHSHLPHVVRLGSGTFVLNPGSVGCPAYHDPTHPAHVSEAGAPHARYAMLAVDGAEIALEQIALTYAWEEAARRAERIGRPEWAHGLRTGFMPGATGAKPRPHLE